MIKEEGDISVMLTTYRNRKGLKAIRRKDKYASRPAIVKRAFGV